MATIRVTRASATQDAFLHMRRTQYEIAMFVCEDDRYRLALIRVFFFDPRFCFLRKRCSSFGASFAEAVFLSSGDRYGGVGVWGWRRLGSCWRPVWARL
jgi:hypothetical protein